MDGAMAQDKNKFGALEDDIRADPLLPPPGEGALTSDADAKAEPAFGAAAPMMLLPPPLPKSAIVDSIASAMAGSAGSGLSTSGPAMAPATPPAFATAPDLPPQLPKADDAPVGE